MKAIYLSMLSSLIMFSTLSSKAQVEYESPAMIATAIAHKVVGPVKDFPALTPQELAEMDESEMKKERNTDLQFRNYPYWEETRPTRPDRGLQTEMGAQDNLLGIIQNWEAQYSYSIPPDCNGTAGPNHYMQTVNVKYTIYDKQGTLVAGPTNLNVFFTGLPGGNTNEGDPVILYDEQAQRWMMAEFSGISGPDYMLIAVSQTDDPTGTWDAWSFPMNGFPDYMKLGVWRDGYYMGTNTMSGNDIYAFERDVMIAGGANPQMVQFNNPNRPSSGFHCVLPLDNDGAFAPADTPGGFITINDNAWGGSSQDQLWVYELDIDWSAPNTSTFARTQQIDVESFDSNFGPTWDNIYQPGPQRLDAINQILMHRAQYRNFSGSQHIVCNHAIDVDNTDHAGIRWYELEHDGTEWVIRQYGTYAPDAESRWMGSIAMNASHEIALGYSVSSTTVHPSIRYAGQSAPENASASGILDVAETSIIEGTASQSNYNRWGDYSNLCVDPADGHTFWFTTEYNINSSMKGTRVASFEFAAAPDAEFEADTLTPGLTDTVYFTDLSSGNPIFWSWTFTPSTISYLNGTSGSSPNPEVRFDSVGFYTVELTATNGVGPNTEIKVDYIEAMAPTAAPLADFEASSTIPSIIDTVTLTDLSINNPTSWEWTFTPGTVTYLNGTSEASQHPDVRFDAVGLYTVELTATNSIGSGTETKTDYIDALDALIIVDRATPDEIVVNLYPNPSEGYITLEAEKEIERVEVIDQTGKVVMMKKVDGNSTFLTAMRSKGLYFVRIYIENENALPTLVTKEFIIR